MIWTIIMGLTLVFTGMVLGVRIGARRSLPSKPSKAEKEAKMLISMHGAERAMKIATTKRDINEVFLKETRDLELSNRDERNRSKAQVVHWQEVQFRISEELRIERLLNPKPDLKVVE
tara:strand:+ start:111 stop:464 length:354 start_codon:yes stop_codon:yes gene_type:complete